MKTTLIWWFPDLALSPVQLKTVCLCKNRSLGRLILCDLSTRDNLCPFLSPLLLHNGCLTHCPWNPNNIMEKAFFRYQSIYFALHFFNLGPQENYVKWTIGTLIDLRKKTKWRWSFYESKASCREQFEPQTTKHNSYFLRILTLQICSAAMLNNKKLFFSK